MNVAVAAKLRLHMALVYIVAPRFSVTKCNFLHLAGGFTGENTSSFLNVMYVCLWLSGATEPFADSAVTVSGRRPVHNGGGRCISGSIRCRTVTEGLPLGFRPRSSRSVIRVATGERRGRMASLQTPHGVIRLSRGTPRFLPTC